MISTRLPTARPSDHHFQALTPTSAATFCIWGCFPHSQAASAEARDVIVSPMEPTILPRLARLDCLADRHARLLYNIGGGNARASTRT